jgi:signal transduction histidine kinase
VELSGLAGTGSGLGLAHLRQRVELVHGTLLAGPAPDGGFCVEATLPAYVPTAEPVG